MNYSLRCMLLLISVIIAAGFCVGTGLIPAWGQWYSPSTQYRRQTDAFLHGSIWRELPDGHLLRYGLG
jgi:hypothetical protein